MVKKKTRNSLLLLIILSSVILTIAVVASYKIGEMQESSRADLELDSTISKLRPEIEKALIEKQKNEQKDKLKGISWYAIGDSITYNNKYQPIIKASIGFGSVTTDAKPGRSIDSMDENISKEKLKGIRLITVFGGTNDYGGNKELGSINDGPEAKTFYGSLRKVIESLQVNKEPNAKIIFITPTKRGDFQNQPVYPAPNGRGVKLEQYVDAIKQICTLYSIPVIDLFADSGIDLTNLNEFTSDNLHPNDAGYKKISDIMASKIQDLLN